MFNKKKSSVLIILIILIFALSSCGNIIPSQMVSETPSAAPEQSIAPEATAMPSDKSTAVSPSSPSADTEPTDSVVGAWKTSVNTVTLDGATVTEEDFKGDKLTVLNIWATWCPPCVGELPHLQEVSEFFKDQGVSVVGVMQDGVNEKLEPDDKTIQSGKLLLESSKADYIVILPDETLMQEFINQMQFFPTTFFLDSEGNVVETVVGSKNAEEWKEVINGVLKNLS